MTAALQTQTSIDEREVQDARLEKALDERETKRQTKAEATKAYKDADERVRAMVEEHDLDDGQAIRVGIYRITRSSVPSREVAFSTDPTSRVSIHRVDT